MCCLVTDGGGALDPDARGAGQGFPPEAGLHPRHRRERRDADESASMEDFTTSKAFRVSARKAFASSRHHARGRRSSDDLRRIRAPADLWAGRSRASASAARRRSSSAERNTAPGGKLPLNTNGGGLSYMHSGMYGMYALQESVRQLRGTAAGPGARGQDSLSPWRRWHVRRQRHYHSEQRGLSARCTRVTCTGSSATRQSYAAAAVFPNALSVAPLDYASTRQQYRTTLEPRQGWNAPAASESPWSSPLRL